MRECQWKKKVKKEKKQKRFFLYLVLIKIFRTTSFCVVIILFVCSVLLKKYLFREKRKVKKMFLHRG
jgi:hypothetical protein